jgi:hypothetical protein
MAKTLTDAQVVHFRERGWLAPMRAMDAEQAAANRSLKIKGHLAMLWVVELARNPFMLDAVEDLIGPDIMVFGASIFAKGGKDRAYVSRHQDNAYFGLEPHEEITAWVAFTQTSAENGALQVLPRTHLGPDLAHEETYAPDNMLARGRSLRIADESSAVTIALQSGEFSLHHERTAHGSKQNLTPRRASDSHSSTFQPMSAPLWVGAAPPWCAAWTVTAIGIPPRCRGSISTRSPAARCAPPGASIATGKAADA